jgi:hypothetical protein
VEPGDIMTRLHATMGTVTGAVLKGMHESVSAWTWKQDIGTHPVVVNVVFYQC